MRSPGAQGPASPFSRFFSSHVPVLMLVFLVAALLRLICFDLMEFKGDEVAALRMGQRWAELGQTPRFGLMSGVGIRNPPGFLYVLTPLTALTDSPLAAGMAIALANLLAVPLLWLAGRALGAPRAGLFAAALMAAHPWLILYSRKIWAQSLLPLYVCAWLLAVALAARRNRSRAVFWAPPLAALAWLTHYSAYGFAFTAGLWLAAEAARRRLNWRAALAGVGVAAILVAPYAAHVAAGGWRDLAATWQFAPSASARGGGPAAGEAILRFAQTAFAGGFGFPFSFRPVPLDAVFRGAGGFALHLAALAATTAVLVLAARGAARRWRAGAGGGGFAAWALLAVLLPLALYALKRVKPEPHYFIVTLPPLLLLAGLGAEGLPRRAAGWTGAGAGTVGAAVWLTVLLTIRHAGGTAGDYGVTYRAQRSVAERLASDPRGLTILDASLTRDQSVGVRHLLARGGAGRAVSSATGTPVMLADASLYPGWRPPPIWTELENPPPGPLRVYVRTGGAAGRAGGAAP